MAQPVGKGLLWEKFTSRNKNKLIIVTGIQDLRTTAIQVSKNISWEQTAQEIAWELTYNPTLMDLPRQNILLFRLIVRCDSF